MKYLKFTNKIETDKNIYTFENGVVLEIGYDTAHVEYPPKDDVGSFGFPVRFPGDVFHALRKGEPIPKHCKAW